MIDITKPTGNIITCYKSPIRFFEQYGIDYNIISTTDHFILEIQKAFNLQYTASIDIEGVTYTEDNLITEVSHPWFSKRLIHHKTIWEKKSLLKFLEQGIVSLKESRYWHSIANDADFVAFVSPYFLPPYKETMKKWLDQPAFESASRWINFLNFMVDNDQKEALSIVSDFMKTNTELFNQATFIDSRLDVVRPWAEQSWDLFMNNLPTSLYADRNNLATAILGFVEKTCKTDMDTAFLIILRLSKLKSLDLQIEMGVNQLYKPLSDTYYKKRELERGYVDGDDTGDSPTPYRIMMIIITILYLLIKLVRIFS